MWGIGVVRIWFDWVMVGGGIPKNLQRENCVVNCFLATIAWKLSFSSSWAHQLGNLCVTCYRVTVSSFDAITKVVSVFENC